MGWFEVIRGAVGVQCIWRESRCLTFGTTIVNEKFLVMENSLACIMCVIILHGTAFFQII